MSSAKNISDPLKIRNTICALEAEMQKQEQIEIEVEHTFAPGVYIRTVFMPKGSLVAGKIHKTEHVNIISQGKVKVVTEEGAQEYEGYVSFVSSAGIKKLVYMLEDTIWTTVHVTEETNLEKLEEELIASSYEELQLETDTKGAKLCHG